MRTRESGKYGCGSVQTRIFGFKFIAAFVFFSTTSAIFFSIKSAVRASSISPNKFSSIKTAPGRKIISSMWRFTMLHSLLGFTSMPINSRFFLSTKKH